MAKATSYRLSKIAQRQIEELARYYGNRTTVVTVAVDRFWRETMNEVSIRVQSIETKPVLDPYRTRGITRSEFWLDPQSRVCAVYQAQDTRSTIGRIWHGIELTTSAPHCDEDRLRKALESEAYQSLLRRVVDGHEVVWDGQNHRGRLSEDARDAWYAQGCPDASGATTTNVASALGITDGRVRQLASELGVGRRWGRDWVFTPEDVAQLRGRNTKRGPKKFTKNP